MLRILIIALLLGGCSEESTPLPCDVDSVLADACRQCHNAARQFGAPMPLLDWEDTQAKAIGGRLQIWESMRERINDPDTPMPPGGTGTLSNDERQILEDWFAAGAPPRAEGVACD